ncbi:Sorting nexin-18 [Bulinus truncatus]|nr:Sorting nexin-18 [Bulinus truncatus]
MQDTFLLFTQGAIGKVKDCLKLQEENKMSESEVQSVVTRADTISYGTLAEMNNFQKERVVDFKLYMQNYLREQIDFYKKLTSKLEDALHHYDNVLSHALFTSSCDFLFSTCIVSHQFLLVYYFFYFSEMKWPM